MRGKIEKIRGARNNRGSKKILFYISRMDKTKMSNYLGPDFCSPAFAKSGLIGQPIKFNPFITFQSPSTQKLCAKFFLKRRGRQVVKSKVLD
jgi:hypothetical protein